jgi:hypothetical protein
MGILLEQKNITSLKIGILIAALAYFLFTLHATFVLSWIGEWEPLHEPTRSWILVTDVTAFVFLVMRFVAGILAAAGAIMYFVKKGLAQSTMYKLLRAVLVLEALYWVGLLPSGIWGLMPYSGTSLLISTGIPCTVAITITISLFMLARNLSPNKPQKAAIKWATLAGFFYVLEFWLNNMGMWIIQSLQKGFDYVLSTPQYVVSFVVTVVGMLVLVAYAGYFALKSSRAQTFQDFSVRGAGVILVALGTYFLWNYLTWIFFGGWNEWYAWVLGHNLDLWLLALPLVGLPMLFTGIRGGASKILYALEGVGAIFVAIFLGAYLAGIPTTTVYHSIDAVRYSLYGLGIVLLVLILCTIILAATKKR